MIEVVRSLKRINIGRCVRLFSYLGGVCVCVYVLEEIWRSTYLGWVKSLFKSFRICTNLNWCSFVHRVHQPVIQQVTTMRQWGDFLQLTAEVQGVSLWGKIGDICSSKSGERYKNPKRLGVGDHGKIHKFFSLTWELTFFAHKFQLNVGRTDVTLKIPRKNRDVQIWDQC